MKRQARRLSHIRNNYGPPRAGRFTRIRPFQGNLLEVRDGARGQSPTDPEPKSPFFPKHLVDIAGRKVEEPKEELHPGREELVGIAGSTESQGEAMENRQLPILSRSPALEALE